MIGLNLLNVVDRSKTLIQHDKKQIIVPFSVCIVSD